MAYSLVKRDNWLDGLKFVLITLVIFGHSKHFLEVDYSLRSVKVVRFLIHVVYYFHMPLFIMLSGYFSKKTDTNKFLKSTFRLLRIFLVFHILWLLIDGLRGEQIDFQRIISPSFTLWYILCLVYWRFILQCLPDRLLEKTSWVLAGTVLISLVGGFIPFSNELSIQRTFTFLPCFFLGYYAKQCSWLENIKKFNPLILIVIAVALIAVESQMHLDYYGRAVYHQSLDIVKRGFFVGSAIILSITFLRCMPKQVSRLASEGRDVLYYYIYHSFVLFFVSWGVVSLHLSLNGITIIIVALLTVTILWISRKIKPLYAMLKTPL